MEHLKAKKYIIVGNMRENGEDSTIYRLSPIGEGEYLEQSKDFNSKALDRIFDIVNLILAIMANIVAILAFFKQP